MHSTSKKYDFLLALRGLSALAVVFCHYPFQLSKLIHVDGLDWLFDPFGYVPVLIFFTLSGYLITLGFLENRHAANTMDGIKKYYLNRIIRIVPLYFFSIVFCTLIYWEKAIQNPKEVFLLFPFIANYKPENGIIFNHVYWTMPVEMLYFATAPFIYLLLKKQIKKNGIYKTSSFIVLAFTVLTYILFYKFQQNAEGINLWRKDWLMTARFDFFYNLQSFILGGICAFFSHKNIALKKSNIPHEAYLISAALFLIGLIFYTTTYTARQLDDHQIGSYFLIYGIVPTVGLWFFLVAAAHKSQNIKNSKTLPILEQLGHIAYGVYLFHMPMLTITESTLNMLSFKSSDEIISLASLGVTIIFALFTYKIIEKPFMDMRRKIGGQRTPNTSQIQASYD